MNELVAESLAGQPWLSLLTFLPLIGAFGIALRQMMAKRGADGEIGAAEQKQIDKVSRNVAFLFTFGALAVSVFIFVAYYDPSLGGFQLVEHAAWLGGGVSYKMGVDGISILFVLLTTFIMPICIAASRAIDKRVPEYMIAFLIMETLILGVFCALDLVVFYLFFEASLIPMFLIIGVWGSKGEKTFGGFTMPSRVYAAVKFFLYTLLGSVLMLVAILWMWRFAGTTDIHALQQTTFPAGAQKWLWLAFFASFAVKMPMWPVHTWLPDAHVQAPTAGSVILASILLKMGGYGFLRFSLPMFPIASADFAPFVYALSIVAIVYTSLVALAQEDMKKLIAYSSVAHMGFVTMGIFTGTTQGIEGGLFQMLSHGFISGALFLCVGVLYDRAHTREIAAYGGLVHRMPFYAFLFLFFTMGNVGLPGISGFVGEFLTMAGAFKVNSWIAFFAAFGVILSAAYALRLYRQVMYGDLTKSGLMAIVDVDKREIAMLVALLVFALFLGVYPHPALSVFAPSVEILTTNYDAALAAVGAR
jgi:NADH-quinone oxidoreductase subunit M